MHKGMDAGDWARSRHRLRCASARRATASALLVLSSLAPNVARAQQATTPSVGAPATPAATDSGAAAEQSTPPAPKDELAKPGYIPGYRPDPVIGMSPYAARVGAMPGGMTPGYSAPMPANDWTFRWTGFLTASLQTSVNNRIDPSSGQSATVFHVPPQTVDEYGSFVGTNTMPGQWAQLNFAYGNRYVTANLSLTTWNPSDPTTFYQLGSQQFINNVYLAYNPPPILGAIRVHALVGYFSNTYGSLGQYGLGMYTNPLIGLIRGVGEDIVAEYDLTDALTLRVEDGIMGDRNGMAPVAITPFGPNGAGQPVIWPSAWVHHFHVGLEKRGDVLVRGGLHYLTNWAQDDRIQTVDNPQTRQINEGYVPDGRVTTYGADLAIQHPILGYFGAAVSYTQASNAYPVKGLATFGGDGESLTNRWFGQLTGGTGNLFAAGVNWQTSVGRIVSYPVPFSGDGPDLSLEVGAVVSESSSTFNDFDQRWRTKFGANLIYTFLPFMGVGLRGDAVFPNSHDAQENFYVLSPRLIFKSDWNSRDTVNVIYGKWFYGRDSHAETSTITPGDRLDDQLFAINVQMYW